MIKICKICGTEFEAKSNRACYCSDECKKEGRKISKQEINKRYYEKNKEYDYNKWNRLNPDEANKWNRLNPDKANKWNRLNPDKSNKWNRTIEGKTYDIERMRTKREHNKQFCGGDIQLDNNGNPKLMMGTSDEKGLNKKQMNDRNEKFKNLFR